MRKLFQPIVAIYETIYGLAFLAILAIRIWVRLKVRARKS